MKPVIGITPTAQTDALAHGTFRRYVLSSPYVRAVEAAGGIPLILPPQRNAASTLVDVIDGLILSGGADVAPARYGDDTVHGETYGVDPERDQFELNLFDVALRQEKPIFGICRGIQVMNVALGGTLVQDVTSEHPGAAEIGHRQHERGLEDSAVGHGLDVREPDLLPIFAADDPGVNSFHHQAIKELAPGLVPVAYSPDCLVEAVVMPSAPWVFGVQWHPELMFERYPQHLRPFAHLVAAATTRKLASISR
jgi:putative glutamine amidotransferase